MVGFAWSRAIRPIRKPSFAKRRAMAMPIPGPAPTTIAVLDCVSTMVLASPDGNANAAVAVLLEDHRRQDGRHQHFELEVRRRDDILDDPAVLEPGDRVSSKQDDAIGGGNPVIVLRVPLPRVETRHHARPIGGLELIDDLYGRLCRKGVHEAGQDALVFVEALDRPIGFRPVMPRMADGLSHQPRRDRPCRETR